MIIGSHVKLSGNEMYLGSVKEALSYNEDCFMVFVGAPQNSVRKNINEYMIDEAFELLKKSNIKLENIVVHAPYIVNLCNPDKSKREYMKSFLISEIERTSQIGSKIIVLHPGSAVGGDKKEALGFLSEELIDILDKTKHTNVVIALETMAGKGKEVLTKFEEIKYVLNKVNYHERIKICLDTCHIYDAGYDIVNRYEEVLKEFDDIVGLDKINCIHLNDSMYGLESHRDRHANIGLGKIGFDTLCKVAHDKRFSKIPILLETPYYEDKAPYKIEIEMIRNKKFDENKFKEL